MNRKGMAIIVLVVTLLFLLFMPKTSRYNSPSPVALSGYNINSPAMAMQAPAAVYSPVSAPPMMMGDITPASLIPRDVTATEDFGQFSPDKILGNQNYLDPRSQIGYPETLGGVLRNANLDIRSQPMNPRNPVSIFNLSTIPPDTMRPRFEIDFEYQ